MAPYDEVIEVAPALHTLRALAHGGIDKIDPVIMHAMRRDNFSEALASANRLYAQRGPRDRGAALTYVVLLNAKELTREALAILRKTLDFHSHDMALQLAQVESLLIEGRDEQAYDLLDGLRSTQPQDPRHWAFMGDLYLDLEHDDDAIACYQVALERESQDFEVAYRLAQLLIDADRMREAADYLERAGHLATNDPTIWEMTGDAWVAVGDFERARDAYERTLRIEPTNARAWMCKGIALSELGEWRQALKALERATKLDGDVADHWLNLGHSQLELGYAEEAYQTYMRAHALDASNVDALNGMVTASFELGDIDRAQRLARRAIADAPDSAESHFNLGMILIALGRTEDALPMFEVAASLEPLDARFSSALAQTLLQTGHREEAFDRIQLVAELADPYDASVLLEFAEALVRQGDIDGALAYFRAYDSRDPIWEVMTQLVRFLAEAGPEMNDELREETLEAFRSQLRRYPELVPVIWDFEILEQAATRLPQPHRSTFHRMIAVLENRIELDELK